MSEAELIADAGEADFVLIGERRDNLDHHRLQTGIVRRAATGRAPAARPCLRDDHRRSPARPGRVPGRPPGGCRRARRGPRLAEERLARLGALRADRRRDARQWRRDHRRRPGSRAKARRVRAGSAGLAQQLRAAHRARPELRHRAHRRSARRAGRCLLRPGAAGGPGRDVPGPARARRHDGRSARDRVGQGRRHPDRRQRARSARIGACPGTWPASSPGRGW